MGDRTWKIELDDDEADTLVDALETACQTGMVFAVDAQPIMDKLLDAGWQPPSDSEARHDG